MSCCFFPLFITDHLTIGYPLLLQKLFVPDVTQSETELKSPTSSDPIAKNVSEKSSQVSQITFIILLGVLWSYTGLQHEPKKLI